MVDVVSALTLALGLPFAPAFVFVVVLLRPFALGLVVVMIFTQAIAENGWCFALALVASAVLLLSA
jgi:hypothetical protein